MLEHVGTHRSLRSQVHNLSVCCRTRMNKVSILDETPNLKSVPSKSTPFSDHSPVGFSTPIRRTRHHQSIACSQNPTCNPGDAGIPWDSMGFHGIPFLRDVKQVSAENMRRCQQNPQESEHGALHRRLNLEFYM